MFLGHEAEHRGGQAPQQHDESPFTEKMMATLRAVAQGNLSACPDVRVKEIDSEVFACSSSHCVAPASSASVPLCVDLCGNQEMTGNILIVAGGPV